MITQPLPNKQEVLTIKTVSKDNKSFYPFFFAFIGFINHSLDGQFRSSKKY